MIRFILENAVDVSTLDAPQYLDPAYPVDNVKKISRTRSVRSTDATIEFIINGDLSSTVDISAMVLARHNFSNTITYRLELFSAVGQSGSLYDTGYVDVTDEEAATSLYQWGGFPWGSVPWGADEKDTDKRQFYDIVWWKTDGAVPNVLSYSIKFLVEGASPTGNPFYCNDISIYTDGVYDNNGTPAVITCNMTTLDAGGTGQPVEPGISYFEVGRIYLGEYIEPSFNISLNHAIAWPENTSQYRANSGTLRSDQVTSNRSFEFDLKTIPEIDKEPLHKKLIAKGLRDDFYLSMFPEDTSGDKTIDYSGLVKFTRVPKYTEFINGYYKSKYLMEEI